MWNLFSGVCGHGMNEYGSGSRHGFKMILLLRILWVEICRFGLVVSWWLLRFFLGSNKDGIDRFVVAKFGGGWPFEYWVVMVFGFCGWQ